MSEIRLEILKNRDMILKNTPNQDIKGLLVVQPDMKIQQPSTRAGVDVIFLLDTSGSMKQMFYNTGKTKQEIVLEAVKSVIPILEDRDTISMISFNSNATQMLDHGRKSAKTQIEAAIEAMRKQDGATDFEQAMNLASTVSQNKKNNVIKIIFLTDGNQVGGSTTRPLEVAEELAKKGTSVDAMGIGGDFNYDVMRKYSAPSNGVTENITKLQDAQRVFRRITRSSQNTVALNGNLHILFERVCRDVKFYQRFPEQRLLQDKVFTDNSGTTYVQLNIGDLSKGASKEFLFAVNTDTNDSPYMNLGTARVSFQDPQNVKKELKQDNQININLADDQNSERIDGNVESAFKEIELLIDYEKALELDKNGNIEEAIKSLKRMLTNAESLGLQEQKKTYQEAINKTAKGNKLSQEDLNKISYQTSRTTKQTRIADNQQSKNRKYQ